MSNSEMGTLENRVALANIVAQKQALSNAISCIKNIHRFAQLKKELEREEEILTTELNAFLIQ